MYMYICCSLPLLESTYLVEGAYKLEIIMFAPVCYYAGNVDLNKCYGNPKRKLGVTTHFSKIIHE